MKKVSIYTLLLTVLVLSVQACGPSEEEKKAAEQARLDSLRIAEQQRIDSLMKAREDSIAQAQQKELEQKQAEESKIEFDENGGYAVQVGAWRSETKANYFVNQWGDRDYPNAYVVKVGDEKTGDIWFRVRIGFFSDENEAEQLGKELASELNTGYWITKVR
ncbi:MAG: SPOR domain-containing protein [Balneolaceae bacterium]|nr:SPOR domain-containing protein [Balneolaceae bacterium]